MLTREIYIIQFVAFRFKLLIVSIQNTATLYDINSFAKYIFKQLN